MSNTKVLSDGDGIKGYCIQNLGRVIMETVAIDSMKRLSITQNIAVQVADFLLYFLPKQHATLILGKKCWNTLLLHCYLLFPLCENIQPIGCMKWKHCTTNWLQDRTVGARRRGREQNPHGDIALFLQEAGLNTSTSQFVVGDPQRYRWHIHTHVCLSPLPFPLHLDVSWNPLRKSAARTRTVCRVSGSHGKKKKRNS